MQLFGIFSFETILPASPLCCDEGGVDGSILVVELEDEVDLGVGIGDGVPQGGRVSVPIREYSRLQDSVRIVQPTSHTWRGFLKVHVPCVLTWCGKEVSQLSVLL